MIKRKGHSCHDTLQNIKIEVCQNKSLFQSYKNIYLTGFNQCTIAQIRIKLTAEDDIESVAQNDDVSNKERF